MFYLFLFKKVPYRYIYFKLKKSEDDIRRVE